MKKIILCVCIVFVMSGIGCARVRVEAPKDPIKVDVSMRLDIYQHVAQDINAIEDIVSGTHTKSLPADNRSCLFGILSMAYAQTLAEDVEAAALRRRDRLSDLEMHESKGIIGEDKEGFVVVRSSGADTSLQSLVDAENADRLVIYQSIARKNGVTLDEIKKIYAAKLQQNAPSGTPVERQSGWQIK